MPENQSPTVVIDPGHGGAAALGGSSANNAVGPNGVLEKNVALDIGLRIAALLGDRARVVLTRSADENRSLGARAQIARDANAAAFLSIHLNGARDAGVDGSEAWVARGATASSHALARKVLDRVVGVTQARDRGVREENFGVLLPDRHAAGTAAALVELAFLTNAEQAARLIDETYKQALAQAIAEGIAASLPVREAAAAQALDLAADRASATGILQAFRAETGSGSFTPTRADVADRAIALVNDPDLVQQGALNLCGPAALHHVWIGRDPVAFARYVTTLYNNGEGQIGSLEVDAGGDLRDQNYYGVVPDMGANVCPAAEWVAMSALRDSENAIVDFEGTPSEDFAGLTTPGEMADWLEATRLYSDVSDEGNWYFTKGLGHALGLRPASDTDVVMLINAHILAGAGVTGKKKSDDFILSAFPNHFVVLKSPVTESAGHIEFDCWTWGSLVHVRVPTSTFESNYYGAVIGRIAAPRATSSALAATALTAGPDRIDGIDCDSRNAIPTWDGLRADGIHFAMFKATEGRTYVDDGTKAESVPGGSFAERRREARANHFLVGSYHYGRASGDLADAPALLRAQADNMIGAVGRVLPGDLPPCYDFEEAHNTADVAWRGADWLAPMEAFLDRVETALGRVPMIYTSRRIWRDFLNDDAAFARLGDYPLWVVRWPAESQRYAQRLTLNPPLPAAWSDWAILQYSGDFTPTEFTNAHAASTGLDMNVSNGGMSVLRGLAGLGRPAPHGDAVRYVAHADENGTIRVLEFIGFWMELDLTELARGPSAAQGPLSAGDVAACEVGGRQYVAFRARHDGHLYEIERDGPNVTLTDLTAVVVNAGTGNDPFYLQPASDPTYAVHGADRAIAYWGQSDHQYLLRNVGRTWQLPALDATANPGVEDASGNAALFVSDGTFHVVGRVGRDGHLVDAQFGNNTWSSVDLTRMAGAPAATYMPAVYRLADGATRVVYRALRGSIHEIDAGNVDRDLSQLAGGAPTCAGNPAVFVLNDVPHVVFRRPDGRIHEIAGDGAGGWTHAPLPCEERAAADPAASVGTDGAFVVFLGRGGDFHEATLTSGGWACARIEPTVNEPPAEAVGLGAQELAAPPTPVVEAADSALVRADRVIPAASCGVAKHGGNYRERTPLGVVIHVLQAHYADVIDSWSAGTSCTPAHYVIRNDGEITQLVAEKYMAHHAGSHGNPTLIGIEHDGWDGDPGYFTEAMYMSSATLVRDICARNGISVDRAGIVGHDEVRGTTHGDPGGYWDWDYYMALVRWDGATTATKPLRAVLDVTAATLPASGSWHEEDRDSGRADWRQKRENAGPLYYSAYGPRYVWAEGAADAADDDAVVYSYTVPEGGTWAVSAWWPVLSTANSAARIDLTTTSSDPAYQTASGVFDQTARWLRTRPTIALPSSPVFCPLPAFDLAQNDVITVRILRRSDQRGRVLADAVRFLRL